jgi:hypothetical protein
MNHMVCISLHTTGVSVKLSLTGIGQGLGQELVACFRPFLEHLVGSDLSPKTIQRHVDNLWLLGGEIIRDLHHDPTLRKLPTDRILHGVIGDDGGPLIHNGSVEEQSSFDSTCRKLHRFLTPHSARPPAARKKGAQTQNS